MHLRMSILEKQFDLIPRILSTQEKQLVSNQGNDQRGLPGRADCSKVRLGKVHMTARAVSHTCFDSLCRAADAVPGLRIDFAQLGGGRCGVEVFSARRAPYHFTQWRVEKSVRRHGVIPSGRVALALHAEPGLTSNAHGESFGCGEIVLTPGGTRIDSVSFAQTNLFGLSVEEDAFAAMVKATGCPVAIPNQGPIRLLSPPDPLVARLRAALWAVREAALTGRGDDAAWQAVAGSLGACLAALDTPGRVPVESPRRRVVRRSLGYIGENLASPLKLSDICRIVGVSERTLIYAFKEHLGLTPKAYMNICRLNMVRREMECGRASSITDAATRWGFWHMGQFSADYKRFFGELPSHTLSRARGRGLGPGQGLSG